MTMSASSNVQAISERTMSWLSGAEGRARRPALALSGVLPATYQVLLLQPPLLASVPQVRVDAVVVFSIWKNWPDLDLAAMV